MKILKITEKNHKKILTEIVKTLKKSGVVALPTDTVFGLIARARDERAVKKIFAIKNRHLGKPISIFVSDIEAAKSHAIISPRNEKILNRFLKAGFLEKITFILPLKNPALRVITAGGKTIGIRIPKDKRVLEILKRIKETLAQTSANPSGLPEARNALEVFAYFKNSQSKPDLVIDGKVEPKKSPSTVIDLTKVPPKIIREGAVSAREIKKLIGSRFSAK
jgi:L-threonylcarbamoyladenylate synthase